MPSMKTMKRRLTREQEILANRLVLGGLSGVLAQLLGAEPFVATAFFVYLSSNIILLLLQLRGKFSLNTRLIAGIVLDFSMVYVVMRLDPVGMAMFYPLMLWVILGNGFRFGLKYLIIASIAAITAFSAIIFNTSYWSENSNLAYSLLAALFVIPAYCSTLIRKLSYAKEQAEVANQAKSYFLASVSHELRTPLNAIIAYGNHLKETRLVPSQKQMVEASVLAGEHLLHLFEQLIQSSHSGATAMEQKCSDFVPAELLAGVRDIMEVRASEKGLYLRVQAEINCDNMVHAPLETVRNVLMNLISNAIKFTDSGGVSVTMRINETDDNQMLQFDVTDTGIGVEKEKQEIIFEAFQQADNTVSSRFGGTGLGLAICQQLVSNISGEISISSEVGKGSVFSVSIPIGEAKDTAAATRAILPASKPRRVIAFGQFDIGILEDASNSSSYDVLHIACTSKAEFDQAVASKNLSEFEVALVDQRLVASTDIDDPIWGIFAGQMTAPVLVEHDSNFDFDDISLRAAFASVVPASADFAALRSAISIGCSFSRHVDSAAEEEEASVNKEPRSILVADDNRTNRNILSLILEAAGHHVTMVTDGDETIEALESGSFDIVLLDVNMPRLSGIDACRMWRQIEGGRQRIPIVGVTADATDDTKQQCLDAGMDARITKPIDAKSLLALIDTKCDTGPAESSQLEDHNDPLAKVVAFSKTNNREGFEYIDQGQIDYLLSIGDHDFLESMVQCYREDTAENLPKFRAAVAEGDVELFRYCAHAFKSSGKNIGAKKLAVLCDTLEFITQANFDRDAKQHLATIEDLLEESARALDDILQNHDQQLKTA